MIVDLNPTTIASVRNPALRSYAEQYLLIYQDFMQQVSEMGLEIEAEDETDEALARVAALGARGAHVRNDNKSIYINRISPGCLACQTSVGSATFFVSLKCHRDCFFCFNPNQEDYEYHREHTRDMAAELEALRASRQKVQHLALTGGEPLLHKEQAILFFQRARQDFPKVYTRLYTCGDHLDHETLQALKKTGLDEIRFSIRLHDLEKGRRHTYERIEMAGEYIPHVMVEMPVLPGSLAEMKDVLTELNRLGVFGINLLELCFPFHNAPVFRERGYRIKPRPFRILYDYWYAGGLPVAGSETVCLDLLEFALDQKLSLGVHYCSLENKHTGQVYQQNIKRPASNILYWSERDFFLKSAKVFGEDVPRVEQFFKRTHYDHYEINKELGFLEFNVRKIYSLRNMDLEVGISTAVLEKREAGQVVRELKVDLTTPQTFVLDADI